MPHHVLIVEDDPDIGALLQMHVRQVADDVRWVADGRSGLMAAQGRPWDLILLDWLLPGLDGVSVCRRLRAHRYEFPIMLLTARSAEADRVQGLDAGADDYLAKPFGVAELKARVRSQLRRAATLHARSTQATPVSAPLAFGNLTVEPASRVARFGERDLCLTVREFDLLHYFARNPGRALTRAQLLAAVWGAGFDGYEHTVNSHINRLRAKLEPDPVRPTRLVTVWGVGYRFNADAIP